MIRVKVTKQHIARGIPASFSTCPVAMAVMELFPEESVTVFSDRIRFVGSPQAVDLQLPGKTRQFTCDFDQQTIDLQLPVEARKFIFDFDSDEDVKPFSFWLPMS